MYAVLSGLCAIASPAKAATYSFLPASGAAAWDNAANWNPNSAFPNAIGDVVNLTSASGASLTVNLNADQTIGTLNLGSSQNVLTTIAAGTPGGILIFNASNGNTANLNMTEGFAASYQAIAATIRVGGVGTTLSINRTSLTQNALNLNSSIDVNGNTLLFNLTDTDTASRVQLNAVTSNITGTGTLIKQGTGTLGTSRNLTFAGDIDIRGGLFSMATGNARLSGFNRLTVSNTSVLKIGDGSGVVNITAANSRLSPSAAGGIHMNSGRIYYTSGIAAGANNEVAPTLHFDSGTATIDFSLGNTSGTNYTMTYDGVQRARGATWVLRSGNTLGTSATTVKLANSSGLSLVGGGGSVSSTTASIVPWMVGRSGGGNPESLTAAEFVTYDATNGFQTVTNYQTNISAATALENVSVTGGTVLASSRTINALRMVANANNTLDLGGNTLTVTSGLVLAAPTGTNVNNISNGTINFGAAEGILNTANTGVVVLSANLQGTNGFTKAGASTLTLSGSAAGVTGPVHVAAGILQMGAANRLNSTAAVVLHNTVTTQLASPKANIVTVLDLNGHNQEIGSLAGGGTDGGNVLLGGATLTTGADNTNTAYDGVISGNGNVVKAGTGRWTLNGNNTYAGTTTVNAGTLVVNGDLMNSSVTVAAGGVLAGEGSVAGDVTITGTVAPGDGVGTLSLNGNVSFASGSAINFELGTAQDLIGFAGASKSLTSAGPITMNYTLGAGFVEGQAYTIFDWSLADNFNVSAFNINNLVGAPAGYTAEYDLLATSVTVTLTSAVPEPSVLILCAIGMVGAIVVRRKMVV